MLMVYVYPIKLNLASQQFGSMIKSRTHYTHATHNKVMPPSQFYGREHVRVIDSVKVLTKSHKQKANVLRNRLSFVPMSRLNFK